MSMTALSLSLSLSLPQSRHEARPSVSCRWQTGSSRRASHQSGKKKQIMMTQGAIACGGRDEPLKKSAGTRPETPRDVRHNPDLLQGASWGGAERSRAVDGQVRCGFAMLPAGTRRQPGCFLTQTVQAPFVFGSVHYRTLNGR
jgi:hypothetical protein